ncbi:MAG: GrpB family protein [Patescibacteria group bacterium]
MNSYEGRKYRVQAYNPSWPKLFEEEAKVLNKIFGEDALSIEHIGSSAVPGMDGKSVIDIVISVKVLTSAKKYVVQMRTLGYEFLPEYIKPDSYLFRKVEDGFSIFNVHVFEESHPHVEEMLVIRDYLRRHPDEVSKYSQLKRGLYEKYPDDYGAYRKFKDEYMEGLERRAREERK